MKKGAAWSRPVTEVPVNWPAALPVRMLWYLQGDVRLSWQLRSLPTAACAGPVYTLDVLHHRSTTMSVTSLCSNKAAVLLHKEHTTDVYLECFQTAASLSPLDCWGEGALPSSPYSWVSSGSSFLRHLIRSLMILRLSSSSLPPW